MCVHCNFLHFPLTLVRNCGAYRIYATFCVLFCSFVCSLCFFFRPPRPPPPRLANVLIIRCVPNNGKYGDYVKLTKNIKFIAKVQKSINSVRKYFVYNKYANNTSVFDEGFLETATYIHIHTCNVYVNVIVNVNVYISVNGCVTDIPVKKDPRRWHR